MPTENIKKVSVDMESNEQKIERYNALWRNKEKTIEFNDKNYSLEDCYDYEIARREKAFKFIQTIANQIPKDSYVLFVDSVEENQGTIAHPEFKFIDKDRRQKMYRAETGSDDLDQDFQPENMRYRLGFIKNDPRFRIYKSFNNIPLNDLGKCVGVVYSGSALNIYIEKDDEEPEKNIQAKENVQRIIQLATAKDIPQLGICFGAQSLIKSYGGEIEKIRDEFGNETRVIGITNITSTEAGTENEFTNELLRNEAVAQNHGQQANTESLKKTTGVILAVSSTSGAPEIVFFPPYTYCVQSHIEGDPTRDDIVKSLSGIKPNPRETFFEHNPTEAGEVIFPKYMETVVKFAQKK